MLSFAGAKLLPASKCSPYFNTSCSSKSLSLLKQTVSSSKVASMATLSYPPIVVKPSGKHSATVIMLHGLGDSGHGWSDIGSQFAADLPNVKFIFPNAPARKITLNMGMMMPGWYDIKSLDGINQQEDAAGLYESKRYVEELVAKEVAAGIPSDKVVVAGFSQGGAVALMMLRSNLKLAGIAGLSTYLPLRTESPVVSEVNKDTPVLLCHGTADQVVMFDFGKMTAEMLSKLGMKLEFKTYPNMGHSACPQELAEIQKFLKERLA